MEVLGASADLHGCIFLYFLALFLATSRRMFVLEVDNSI